LEFLLSASQLLQKNDDASRRKNGQLEFGAVLRESSAIVRETGIQHNVDKVSMMK